MVDRHFNEAGCRAEITADNDDAVREPNETFLRLVVSVRIVLRENFRIMILAMQDSRK
jgi:hypothetical protein